jgi:outer membrane lipoprotein
MKWFSFIILIILTTLISCAPVLRQEVIEKAIVDVQFSSIRQHPDLYKGKVFILGGLIVSTKLTEKGSLIEAVYIPADTRGYLKDVRPTNGRFMAIYPKDIGILDPFIYKEGREITIAGEFIETQTGRIGEMEYTYPVFEIKEIYLWEEKKVHYLTPAYPPSYYYPYPSPYPYWYDPWWRDYYPPPPLWYVPPKR